MSLKGLKDWKIEKEKTLRNDSHVVTEAEIGHRPRIAGYLQKLEEVRKDSFPEVLEGTWSFLDFRLQASRNVGANFYCFKLLSPLNFVKAALGS